jgi:predicted ATPase
MIKTLTLQNFKCFQEKKTFEFSRLNLLTGINGRGKSTLLQAMLILTQSAWQSTGLKKLIIDGNIISLGNFDDIRNSETTKGTDIYFKFQSDSAQYEDIELEYTENPKEPFQAVRKKARTPGTKSNEKIIAFSNMIKKIHFVSADRLGPVKYVGKVNLPEFINVGQRGEYTINVLANAKTLENAKTLGNIYEPLYRGKDSISLIQQTTEWLSYILEGAKIDIGGKDAESSVLYMLLNNRENSYKYKPINVGFGYSYILPLIVTGLIARQGEIIIIENPEAHLHPRAQSRIAEFFAIVASCGVQVFIESHSEHILNGLRVSALKPEIAINHDEIAIHYFSENFESEKLIVDSKGKIENWPSGFFDQEEIDLSNIFKYGR